MDVILLERIGRLGQIGDTVRVRDGYARNYLLPSGRALRANDANRARFEAQKSQIIQRNEERKADARSVADRLEGKTFVAVRSAGETGQLYGSVSARDVADLMAAEGFKVGRNEVAMQQPIKMIGVHSVLIALHPEVEVTINVNVARSPDEAQRQAAGEDRAARRRPRAHCHALVHLEADLPLDPLGHRLAEHLIHITRVMGEPQPAGKGRGGNVPAVLFDESIGEEDIRELRKLRHRKAVRGVETGVEGGMMDDGKPHGATDSARACQRTARPADASGRAGYEGSAALTFRSARIGPCDFSSRFRTGLCRSGTFAPGRREGRMRLASAELT